MLLVGITYASLPWFARTFGPRLAAPYGLEKLEIEIAHPTASSLHVPELRFELSGYAVEVDDAELTFEVDRLFGGALDEVRIRELTLTEQTPSEPTAPGSGLPPWIASPRALMREVPAVSVVVDRVRLSVASMALDATGDLEVSAARFALAGAGAFAGHALTLGLDVQNEGAAQGVLAVEEVGRVAVQTHTLAHDAVAGTFAADWAGATLPFGLTAHTSGAFAVDPQGVTVGLAGGARFAAIVDGARVAGRMPEGARVEVADGVVRALGRVLVDYRDAAVAVRATADVLWGELETGAGGGSAAWTVVAGDAQASGEGEAGYADGQVTFVTSVATAAMPDAVLAEPLDLKGVVALEPLKVDLQPFGANVDTPFGHFEAEVARVGYGAGGIVVDGRVGHARSGVGGALSAEHLDGTTRGRFEGVHVVDGALVDHLLPDEGFGWELVGGNLQFAGTFELVGDAVRVDANVGLGDGQVRSGDVLATGLAANVDLSVAEGRVTMAPAPLTIAAVDLGVPVTNVNVRAAFDGEVLTLDALSANALGSSVTASPIELRVPSLETAFELTIDGLELTQVLALEGDTIVGEGVLDGQVPVSVDAAGAVTVTAGRFTARRPGGRLRYADAGFAAAALGATGGFAVAPLGDYRFDVMDVAVDYAADGTLALGVRLEGKNPAFESGRRVHYNLNITENVLTLLESLRVAEQFEDRVRRAQETKSALGFGDSR